MSVAVEILSPAREEAYRAYTASRPGASFYHSLDWRDVLVGGLRLSPRYLVALDAGRIGGVLPLCVVESVYFGRRLVSLPYCRAVPVLADGPEAERALVARAVTLAGELSCRTLELRTGELAAAGEAFTRAEHFANYRLDIADGAGAFLRGPRCASCRQSVRRAARDGFTVREGRGVDDYRTFHALVRETRRRQGAPALPFDFYRGICQAGLRGAPARLYLCARGGETAAGCVVVRSAGAAHMFDAVSTTRREVLRSRPNHLLVWRAVHDAIAEGLSGFDFGPNHRSNTNLSFYKMSWGASEEAVPHFVRAMRRGRNDAEDVTQPVYGVARWLIRNTPEALYEPWGSRLYLEVL